MRHRTCISAGNAVLARNRTRLCGYRHGSTVSTIRILPDRGPVQPRILTVVLLVALGAPRAQTADISRSRFRRHESQRNAGCRRNRHRGRSRLNQDAVVTTDAKGDVSPARAGTGVVFVSTPDGYSAVGDFWRPADYHDRPISFALTRLPRATELTFVHASDTHISPASLRAHAAAARPRRFAPSGSSAHHRRPRARCAARAARRRRRGYYELFMREARRVQARPCARSRATTRTSASSATRRT